MAWITRSGTLLAMRPRVSPKKAQIMVLAAQALTVFAVVISQLQAIPLPWMIVAAVECPTARVPRPLDNPANRHVPDDAVGQAAPSRRALPCPGHRAAARATA